MQIHPTKDLSPCTSTLLEVLLGFGPAEVQAWAESAVVTSAEWDPTTGQVSAFLLGCATRAILRQTWWLSFISPLHFVGFFFLRKLYSTS